MAILTITSGAHWRNTNLPTLAPGEERQFAHRWDPDEPEDVAHQAQNFMQYAHALGGFVAPLVLIPPVKTDDEVEWAHIQVNMSDWADIVETGMNMQVDIR